MIHIAIVDDSRPDREALKECLRRYGEENRQKFDIREFEDGEDIVTNYSADFDLILMDIEMAFLNGMRAAERIRELDQTALLIFTTNMPQYAIQGYKVNAMDFLLKPVVYEQLAMMMDKVLAVTSKYRKEKQLLVTDGESKYKISTDEILYIEVIGHDMFFHTAQKVYTRHGIPLKNMADELAEYYFVKSGQSQLVNLKYVDEVKKDTVSVNGTQIYLSRSRKKEFLEALADYVGMEI